MSVDELITTISENAVTVETESVATRLAFSTESLGILIGNLANLLDQESPIDLHQCCLLFKNLHFNVNDELRFVLGEMYSSTVTVGLFDESCTMIDDFISFLAIYNTLSKEEKLDQLKKKHKAFVFFMHCNTHMNDQIIAIQIVVLAANLYFFTLSELVLLEDTEMEKQHWLDLLDEFLWFSVEEVLRAYTRLWRVRLAAITLPLIAITESEQSNHETSEPRLTLTATLYDGYQEADSKIPIKRVECAQGDLVETIKRLQSDAAFFRDRYVEYCSKVLDSDLNFPLQSAKCWLKKIYHLRNPKSAFKPKCVTLMNAYSSEVPKVLVWSRVLSEKDLAAFEETYVHVLLDVKDNPFGPLSQFAVNFPESVYAACKVGIIEQMEDVCLFEIACVPDCIETGEFTLRMYKRVNTLISVQ